MEYMEPLIAIAAYLAIALTWGLFVVGMVTDDKETRDIKGAIFFLALIWPLVVAVCLSVWCFNKGHNIRNGEHKNEQE